MKKLKILLLISLTLSLFLSCAPQKRDLAFFYLELCPGCDSYKKGEELSQIVEGLDGLSLNVVSGEAGQTMKDFIDKKDLPDISRSLPLLVVDEEYYVGYEEIETILRELDS